jgi:hypothetical protein
MGKNIQKAKKQKKKKNELFNNDNLKEVYFYYRGATLGSLTKIGFDKLRKNFKYINGFDLKESIRQLDDYCELIDTGVFKTMPEDVQLEIRQIWVFLIYELVRRNHLKNDYMNGFLKIYDEKLYGYNVITY